MSKNKAYCVVSLLVIVLLFLAGCTENQPSKVEIKYKSTEEVILEEKQGKMTFDVSVRTNESSKTVRLWVPYPVSNENQKIENITIYGNYNYSGIYREGEHGNMIIYAEWYEPEEFPNLNFSFDVWRGEMVMKNFPDVEGFLPIDVEDFSIL